MARDARRASACALPVHFYRVVGRHLRIPASGGDRLQAPALAVSRHVDGEAGVRHRRQPARCAHRHSAATGACGRVCTNGMVHAAVPCVCWRAHRNAQAPVAVPVCRLDVRASVALARAGGSLCALAARYTRCAATAAGAVRAESTQKAGVLRLFKHPTVGAQRWRSVENKPSNIAFSGACAVTSGSTNNQRACCPPARRPGSNPRRIARSAARALSAPCPRSQSRLR